jgi:hypothetical protein
MNKHPILLAAFLVCMILSLTLASLGQASGDFQSLTSTPTISLEPSPVPVIVSTPLGDGTVLHIIAGGQTLVKISEAYNLSLEELREINQLEPDAILNVGFELIIQPSYTPTNTPIGEPSPTHPPRFSHTPSPIGQDATQGLFTPRTLSPTETRVSAARFQSSTKNPTIVILAVVISGGTLFAALYFSTRKKD